MFDDVLIESAGKDKTKGRGVTAVVSAIIHILIIAGIIVAGYYVKKNPEVIQKPIRAFMVAVPPPPPPPPPPAGPSASTPTPQVEIPKTEQPTFHQPTEVPKEVPQVANTQTNPPDSGITGGQPGGVEGGVVGGVAGGVVGGTIGGQLGGQIGGTGDRPVRVGGDVKAPVATFRIEPEYTEVARKGRIEGMVIIEAIIDRNGNVTDARILKGLPLGLDQVALAAVKRWTFKPGTLNGQPVPVIYNLTVNFRLQ